MAWRARLGEIGIVVCVCAVLAAPMWAQDGGNSVSDVFDEYPDLLGDGGDDLPDIDASVDEGSDFEPRDGSGYDDLDDGTGFQTEEMPSDGGLPAPAAPQPRTPAPQIAPRQPQTRQPVESIPAGDPLESGGSYDGDVVGQDAGDMADVGSFETIRERYPDGSVRIERGVTQDEQENYINHGPWRLWDEDGTALAEGEYRLGKRHGRWIRLYQGDEVELFSLPPFNLFNGPFRSQAEFVNGELDGNWIISDASGNKICDWQFVAGRRNGDSVWYYHTGQTMRVIQYQNGQIHGELLEWDVDGNALTNVEYIDGRRLEKTVETFEDGSKKVEGMVLQAQLIMKEPDQWWDAKLAKYERRGKDEKHGEWKAWHPTGVPKFTGEYKWDKPSGEFNWWHPNGQKSLVASYDAGRKTGQWMWWHENGQKSIQGQYLNDSPIDRWVWWHESGKVAQRVNFSGGSAISGAPMTTDGSVNSIILNQPQN